MIESIYMLTFTNNNPTEAANTAEDAQESYGEAYAYVPEEQPTPSPCACPCPLEARLKRLEERLGGVIENHHLWDGS